MPPAIETLEPGVAILGTEAEMDLMMEEEVEPVTWKNKAMTASLVGSAVENGTC